MSLVATKLIPAAALDVLAGGEVRDGVFFLPPGQLDRKLYEAVNDVLGALGGKWVRSRKGHVFADDAADRIAAAVTSGSYSDPKALAYFPTPAWLARDLVRMADVRPGHLCLEPSSGEGAIARELAAVVGNGKLQCWEIDGGRAKKLDAAGFVTFACDFLTAEPMPFDRIVMNPPFSVPGRPQADVDHVLHALRFLAPEGMLVSVMSAGVMHRTNERSGAFRDLVASRDGTMEPLTEGAFDESGTSVRTCVVRIPAGGAR